MPGAKFTAVSVQPTEDAGVGGRDNHFPGVGYGTAIRAGTCSRAPLGGTAHRMYHLSKKSFLFPLWHISQCVGMCVSVCSSISAYEGNAPPCWDTNSLQIFNKNENMVFIF